MGHVVVVGAGCFGAWTAYRLALSGHTVTLLDAYGPGNSRASSGGETRVIRMGYGAQEIYTRWSWRSLELWKALSERAGEALFHETGVLWMAHEQDELTASTLATLERVGVPHERLSRGQLESRWPQIDSAAAGPESFETITWAIHEPLSGVLMARRAVNAVVREAVREGARYADAVVKPPAGTGGLTGGTNAQWRSHRAPCSIHFRTVAICSSVSVTPACGGGMRLARLAAEMRAKRRLFAGSPGTTIW